MNPVSHRLAALINAVAEASAKNQPAILAVLQEHAALLISEVVVLEARAAEKPDEKEPA